MPIHQHHHLVTRGMSILVRENAPWFDLQMSLGVPPVRDNVAATAKRHLVVDDHHLLIVAGAKRHVVRLPKVDRCPRESALGAMSANILVSRDAEWRLPDEYPDFKLRPGAAKLDENPSDLVGIVRPLRAVWNKSGARIERPPEDVDRAFRSA
jgi:hypothetical protein